MAKSAVVIDGEYLKHAPGQGHPERPERIKALLDLAGGLDSAKFQLLPPRSATRAEVELVHTPDHVRLLEATSGSNRYALDGDTITCRDSFGVGLLAAGGFLNLLDAIAAGEASDGFALVRPPGHHALSGRAMGFCLFNTMAIGAEYLKRAHGASRILIMDWDVHHGNGTQDSFFEDPTVLFISTHQYPFYPGSGAVSEIGAGAGEGYTMNVPLPAGCGDPEYRRVFREIVIPAAEKFAPQWVLVSAGFDPHRRDPLGGMGVTERGFADMAVHLCDVAARFSGSRVAFLLEGGYDLGALKDSVAAVLTAMRERPAGARTDSMEQSSSGLDPLLRRIRQVHEKYR